MVKEGVLIPRPETEMVVDLVAEVEGFEKGLWADLGTGSGAIAVGIGRMLQEGGRVFATDLSPVALEVARLNVERYELKVSFFKIDYSFICGMKFGFLIHKKVVFHHLAVKSSRKIELLGILWEKDQYELVLD